MFEKVADGSFRPAGWSLERAAFAVNESPPSP